MLYLKERVKMEEVLVDVDCHSYLLYGGVNLTHHSKSRWDHGV